MQITRAGLLPAVRPQSFQASPKARFGNKDIQAESNTSISTDRPDPTFIADLQTNDAALNHFYKALQNGTIQFLSAEESLPMCAAIEHRTVMPEIRFKLNDKQYTLTMQGLDNPGVIVYKIKNTDGPRSEFAFSYHPKGPGSSSEHIEMTTFHDGNFAMTSWSSRGSYFPQSNQGPYAMPTFPRPEMAEKAKDLGKLLLVKLGESRQAQGITSPLLPEPQKRLDQLG